MKIPGIRRRYNATCPPTELCSLNEKPFSSKAHRQASKYRTRAQTLAARKHSPVTLLQTQQVDQMIAQKKIWPIHWSHLTKLLCTEHEFWHLHVGDIIFTETLAHHRMNVVSLQTPLGARPTALSEMRSASPQYKANFCLIR